MTKSKPVIHISYQIRFKQRSGYDWQKSQQKLIKEWGESDKNSDISGEKFYKKILSNLGKYEEVSGALNKSLQDYNKVGFPIKYNKTKQQIEMAVEVVKSKEDDLLSDIIKGKWSNGLNNSYEKDKLPVLQQDSTKYFWGNENPSVSSVLLAATNYTLSSKNTLPKLNGAVSFFPFYSEKFKLSNDVVKDYPFANQDGLFLFGDYQFGGHRYFNRDHPKIGQSIFAPEDCSSAVVKATFQGKEIENIYTGNLKDNGYKVITSTQDKGGINYNKISEGDIYLRKSHCAIIKNLDKNKINVSEFNRDIDRESNKFLGGGERTYNLDELLDKDDKGYQDIYVLRREGIKPMKESIGYGDLIQKIDEDYLKYLKDEGTIDFDSQDFI